MFEDELYMKTMCKAIFFTLLLFYSILAIGMVISEKQVQALSDGIKLLTLERDLAVEEAKKWKEKANRICT